MGDMWGAGYSDPEDDDEADAAEERKANRRGKTPAQLEKETRDTAQGFSVVPEGEAGEDILKALARSHVHSAVATLVDVMENGTKDAARNTAARELLARGFGSVTRKSEQKVDVKIHDQRAAHFAALQELAKENPVLDITDAEFEEIDPATPKRITGRKQNDDD